MAIRINFDVNHNAETPTFVLSTRGGKKLGSLPSYGISFGTSMKESSELFFSVNREENGNKFYLWDQIKDLKLVYCPEWDAFFEITVDLEESTEAVKNIIAKPLGKSELSNTFIYNTEINTENDIARDDYIATVFYDSTNPESSLLNRIMEKVPNYKIVHVDESIANIQRQFSFDRISIYEAFEQITEEIDCYFKIETKLGEDNKIERTISVFDLKSYCLDCKTRNDFSDICPECGSSNFINGYGVDTTIFVSADNLADTITDSVDTDSVKNCYKMSAGDELMTATIINCNPNGSSYLWCFSEDSKEDMSDDLKAKLAEYDETYDYYYYNHISELPSDVLSAYNALIVKYSKYSDDFSTSPNEIIGYPQLIGLYYDSIDFQLFLESGLMPNTYMQETTAESEAQKLTSGNMPFIAVTNADVASSTTASSAALSIAKTIIDSRYQVKVNSSEINSGNWIGNFLVTSYSDEEDSALSTLVEIPITDDYESFVQQKIDKALGNNLDYVSDINSLFKLDLDLFTEELKKYSLNRLTSYYDACQACLNVLIEQGVADRQTWTSSENDLYSGLYVPYYNKLSAIEDEIKLRESEIDIVCGRYDSDGILVSNGLQTLILAEKSKIQAALNYEDFFGEELWLELISYRREETYENTNYISDSLSNADLIKNAMEFISKARKDIKKASSFSHSISTTLKNLLALKEFSPLVDYFELGNWIRLNVDNKIYRLRLTKYKIDFDNLDNIDVEFSDATSISNDTDKARKILHQASSIASTYAKVTHKAELGQKGNEQITNLVSKGISVSQTKIVDSSSDENMSWGLNGIMLKKYDDISEEYDSCQLKIYNSTISLTDNNWKNVKTAIGGYYYTDPETGKLKYAYGINAEVLIGKLILGEQLGIYNESGSLLFNSGGLLITNGTNSFNVNPNSDILLRISNGIEDVFYIDKDGRLFISADGTYMDIESNSTIAYLNSSINQNAVTIEEESTRATGAESALSDQISSETTRAESVESNLLAKISDNTSLIGEETSRATTAEEALSARIDELSEKIDALSQS